MSTGGKSAHKKGFPYTWLPNHLIDGNRAVSPRSFCTALREAAEFDTVPMDWSYPLYFKGLIAGVQKASEIRVTEVSGEIEGYPWVKTVMDACESLLIPTDEQTIIQRWKDKNILLTIKSDDKLPPLHIEEGERGLLTDLESLGIISRESKNKERIQVPDVYRVTFKMGRKGGVPRMK